MVLSLPSRIQLDSVKCYFDCRLRQLFIYASKENEEYKEEEIDENLEVFEEKVVEKDEVKEIVKVEVEDNDNDLLYDLCWF